MLRAIGRWDPWQDMAQLGNDFGRLLDPARAAAFRATRESPAVNVLQGEHTLVISADMPGVDPDEIDLTVTRDQITLRAKPTEEPADESAAWYRRERETSGFDRTIDLPFAVDPAQTEAVCERGVLTLTLHRPEEEKPRKITIKSS